MGGNYELRRSAGLLAIALALLLPSGPGRADDSELFSTAVTPNVMLYVDNSGSMNNVVWHPAFDPTKPSSFYGCTYWADDGGEQYYTANSTQTRCGNTRTIFYDSVIGSDSTRWSNRYLNWYFSNATNENGSSGSAIRVEVFATNNGTNGTCAQGLGAPATYGKYRRTRVTAVQDVLRNVICDVNAAGEVRFGLAQFRKVSSSSNPTSDVNGGYVLVPVNDYKWDHDGNAATPKIAKTYTLNGISRTHEEHLKSAIVGLDGESMTPLGEGLFQIYTYFMSRTDANRPFGKDGVTRFPKYVYQTDATSGSSLGGTYSSSGPPTVPDSPVQYTCQKNFVVVLTDGEPTMDRFSVVPSTNAAAGFADFKSKLIGDYNPDNTNPEAGNEEPDCFIGGFNYRCAYYLDDVAKFMHEKDFRPDMTGDQTLDVYTVGFTTGTNTPADYVLRKAASVGGGTAYSSNDPDALSDSIVSAIADIVQKSQAFTAATVPATRTAAGGNFYTSLFVPYEGIPYWEGHLKSFQLAANGDILDRNGVCAVDDPVVGQCKGGPFKTTAVPYWDAGQQVPGPATRKLLTSVSDARIDFDMASISAVNLTGLSFATAYPGSTATNVEGLADEIVQNVRGCVFGTGVSTNVSTPSACTARPWLLGDIFHSNPVVVGSPSGFLNEVSYKAFASNATYATRKRVIYAGANDGFLRGFDAGTYQASASPPGYDRGTGTELFGFMPWPVRHAIKDLPLKTDRRGTYYVDGSPSVADVWLYPTATATTKDTSGSEWKTVLIGGLRQGGKGYYALDITDPASGSYPGYLWEYPQEWDAASLALLGESWSDPVITRVRVKIGSGTYERWVAVVGGGYSVTGDPNNAGYSAAATEGRGLFMIDIATGRLLAKKVFGPGTGQVPDMLYAIPSTPAVLDLDFDGFADVIYVGDLGGNLWKWVVNAAGDDPINSTGDVTQPRWPFKKFFTTPGVVVGSSTFYKSVFYPPAATYVNKQLWLAWGTGERTNLRFGDPAPASPTDNNRLYAMSDHDPYEALASPLPTLTEADLDPAPSATTCNPPASDKPGYYIVAENSEKFVTNVEIFASYIFAGSFTPTSTTDPCSSGGTAALYVVKIQCGSGFFGATISPAPRRLTLGAGMPTDPRLTISSDGGSSDSNRVIVNKQQGDVSNIEAPPIPSGGAGVLYWRERP